MSESKGLDINWLGVTGSALGSVSAAVALSTLGAAGTLIGAALGSLFITVGGTFYAHTLRRAKSGIVKVAERVTPASRASPTPSGTAPYNGATSATVADDNTSNASKSPSELPATSWRRSLRGLPWKRIAWLTAGLFSITMAVILTFELSTGRPVSSYTGGTSGSETGTSLSGWTNGNDDEQQPVPGQQEDQEQAPEQQQDQEDNEEQQLVVPDSDEEPAPEQVPAPPTQEQAPQPGQEAPPQQEPVEPAQ